MSVSALWTAIDVLLQLILRGARPMGGGRWFHHYGRFPSQREMNRRCASMPDSLRAHSSHLIFIVVVGGSLPIWITAIAKVPRMQPLSF